MHVVLCCFSFVEIDMLKFFSFSFFIFSILCKAMFTCSRHQGHQGQVWLKGEHKQMLLLNKL